MHDAFAQVAETLTTAGATVLSPPPGADGLIVIIMGSAGPHLIEIVADGPMLRLTVDGWSVGPAGPAPWWAGHLDKDHPPSRTVQDAATGAFRTVLEMPVSSVTQDPGQLHRNIAVLIGAVEEGLRRSMPTGPAPAPSWRGSQRRTGVLNSLLPWGRVLSQEQPAQSRQVYMEERLLSLQKSLLKMRRPHALLIGHPGTGKTALVKELARRMADDSERLLEPLRDRDVFELSVTRFRGGAGTRGMYEDRMATLIGTLSDNPQVILFVDEVHQFVTSAIHERSAFSQGDQSFKQAIGEGRFSIIGATTLAEFHHHIEPDGAIVRRFGLVRIEPPTPRETLEILRGRRAEFEAHYHPLAVPDGVLRECVERSEDYLLGRYQPDKALDILDEACAEAQAADARVVEARHVRLAIDDEVGRSTTAELLSPESIAAHLTDRIVGQDAVVKDVAARFISGLADPWLERRGPRGCWMFCGQTGTGKTELALELAELLGSGRDAVIRVDCNTLGGSNDPGPALSRLLGASRGYVGYSRGEGGLLSRIRNTPQAIVLFDEIEKTSPKVVDVLLQLMDSGQLLDADHNVLDFRRAFVIFTTNAASESTGAGIGFVGNEGTRQLSTADPARRQLAASGFSPAFLARIEAWLSFQPLTRAAGELLVRRRLTAVQQAAADRGYSLTWDSSVVGCVLDDWAPRAGARLAFDVLQQRVTDQLLLAERSGDLAGVRTITLRADPDRGAGLGNVRVATRGDTLSVTLG